jgi:hypothetical protein
MASIDILTPETLSPSKLLNYMQKDRLVYPLDTQGDLEPRLCQQLSKSNVNLKDMLAIRL